MFIVVTITGDWTTRHAAFTSNDEATDWASKNVGNDYIVEFVEEDEDLFYSINR